MPGCLPGCLTPWLQVGLKKGQGDLGGAIELLRQYLDVQQTDWVAWEELADLYLQIQVRFWVVGP